MTLRNTTVRVINPANVKVKFMRQGKLHDQREIIIIIIIK